MKVRTRSGTHGVETEIYRWGTKQVKVRTRYRYSWGGDRDISLGTKQVKVRTRYRYSWGEDRNISPGDKTGEDKSKLEIIMVRWRLRSSLLGIK